MVSVLIASGFVLFLLVCFEAVSLCDSGRPGTHRNPPVSASGVLVLKPVAITLESSFLLAEVETCVCAQAGPSHLS